MPLNLQSQTVNLVKDSDLSTFITEAYGLQENYELIDIEALSNGAYKLSTVEREPLSSYEQQQLETLKAKGYCGFVTKTVLKDLCNKGWLEPGAYLVRRSW